MHLTHSSSFNTHDYNMQYYRLHSMDMEVQASNLPNVRVALWPVIQIQAVQLSNLLALNHYTIPPFELHA